MVLNLVNRQHQAQRYLPWNDPVIWSSGLLLIWLLAAASFSLFYRPARQGRKVAYLTVASFVFLVLAHGHLALFVQRTHPASVGSAALGTRNAEPKTH